MANSTNLARTFLIAACWLGTVRLLPAGERTIVLRDYLNQQWTNQLLAYPFSAPEGTCHPESVVLTGRKVTLWTAPGAGHNVGFYYHQNPFDAKRNLVYFVSDRTTSRGQQTRKASSMAMRWFGNRSGVRWLAAWMAATVVWGVATEVPAQRQSPPEENKASAAGAETHGRAADAGQRDKHPATNGQNRMGSSVADSRDRWLLRGSRKKGFEHLGLDSEGTGRQRVNLLQQPARLEFDDPEEQLRLPDAWTVFAPVYFDDPAPAACELRSLPERLELAGRPLTRKRARPDGARLDLAPLKIGRAHV